MYKMDLKLNNQQWLICNETKPIKNGDSKAILQAIEANLACTIQRVSSECDPSPSRIQ